VYPMFPASLSRRFPLERLRSRHCVLSVTLKCSSQWACRPDALCVVWISRRRVHMVQSLRGIALQCSTPGYWPGPAKLLKRVGHWSGPSPRAVRRIRRAVLVSFARSPQSPIVVSYRYSCFEWRRQPFLCESSFLVVLAPQAGGEVRCGVSASASVCLSRLEPV